MKDKPMRTGERSGYWIVQWSEDTDPSLADVLTKVPKLVLGRYVAIVSCDSGRYRPDEKELKKGWSMLNGTALSPKIDSVTALPTPGFDEWYVYEDKPTTCPDCAFVNEYDFSPLDSYEEVLDQEVLDQFWLQVEMTKPLHVLGAGTPNIFVVTRDPEIVERLKSLNTLCDSNFMEPWSDDWTQQDVKQAMQRGDLQELIHVPIFVSLNVERYGREWAENICMTLANHPDFNVRGNAVLGFGHIARICKALSVEKILPIVKKALNDDDDYVRDQATCAAEDIQFFLHIT